MLRCFSDYSIPSSTTLRCNNSLQEEKATSDIVDLDELSEQTSRVLHLAKHAILYSISAIDLAERQKSEGNAEQAYDHPVITKPGQAYL